MRARLWPSKVKVVLSVAMALGEIQKKLADMTSFLIEGAIHAG